MNEELIPDFDTMETLAEEAAKLKANVIVTKAKLVAFEAQVMREALTNNDNWIGGKRPSMAYCEKIVKYLGNNEEDKKKLIDLRTLLAEQIEEHQLLEHLINLNRDKLDLYRTLSANTRKSFI